MKTTTRSTLCALAVLALSAGAANAQMTSNTTRAAVKADAAAAPKPAMTGEQSVPRQNEGGMRTSTGMAAGGTSVESRAAVKAEAASSVKAGSDRPMGQASQKDQDKGRTKPN